MDDDFETIIEALQIQRSVARHAVEICNHSRHRTKLDQYVDKFSSIYEETDELIRNIHRGRPWISGGDEGIRDVGAYMHDVHAQLLRTEDAFRERLTSGYTDKQTVQHEDAESWMGALMDIKPNVVCAKTFSAILQQGNKIKDFLSPSGAEEGQHGWDTVPCPTAGQIHVGSPPGNGWEHGPSAVQLKHLNFQLEAMIGTLQGRVRTPMTQYPPVHDAAIIGDLDLMRSIVRENPDIISLKDDFKMTPVAYAIEHGHTKMVGFLLKEGVDVNAAFGRYDTTPLGQALRCRRLDITKLLLTKDVDLAVRDQHGWTALYNLWISDENAPAQDFLRALRTRRDFNDLFHRVRDETGWYPLHRAAAFGHEGDVKLLINYGLDAYARVSATCLPGTERPDGLGWRPLHIAAYYGRLETVRILLPLYERVGMVDVKDEDGATSLHLAIHRGQLEIAKLLLADGASWRRQASFTWLKDQEAGRGHSARLLSQSMGRGFHGQLQSYVRELRALRALVQDIDFDEARDDDFDTAHSHVLAHATGLHSHSASQQAVQNDQDDASLRLRRQPPNGYTLSAPMEQQFQRTYGDLSIRDGQLHQGDVNNHSINIHFVNGGARVDPPGQGTGQHWWDYYLCMGMGELDD